MILTSGRGEGVGLIGLLYRTTGGVGEDVLDVLQGIHKSDKRELIRAMITQCPSVNRATHESRRLLITISLPPHYEQASKEHDKNLFWTS